MNDKNVKGKSNTAGAVKAKDTKKLFFSGVIVLTLANIIVKIIGAFLKVPLQSILTDNGMSYYSAAYDIYVWFYMISTAGLPVAVSIMISDSRAKGNFRDAKKIFRVVFAIFLIIGAVGTSAMIGLSGAFEKMYQFSNVRFSIMAIAPTMFFICLSSAYRGYFQGHQEMRPTAISEVIEAIGKLSLGIAFALWATKQGYPYYVVASFTLIGLSIGSACGMLYLFLRKRFFKEAEYNANLDVVENKDYVTPTKTIVKTLLAIGIPITISSSVMSFTNVIDGMILSSRLQSLGYLEEQAKTLFGNYKTLAVTMFNMPPSLIYPITASIVPLLSAALSGGKKKLVTDTMNSSLRVCSIIALPCAFGMSALSYPLLSLLFNRTSAQMAAPLLSVLAPSIFFLSMFSVTNSFLQSHKYQVYPIISIIAGSCVKLLSSYVFIGTKGIEMYGAPIGTFLCYLTTMLLNFFFIAKKMNYVPKIKDIFLKPLISAVMCAVYAWGSYQILDMAFGLNSKINTIIAIIVAAVVYFISIFALKAITKDDVLLLPKGEKIAKILEKKELI